MAAHTPGPWTLSARHDRDGRRVVEEGRGYALARVCPMASSPLSGPQYFEQDANAILIAAAPELLAALKNAQQAIHSEYCGDSERHSIACNEARAAIAKAEGR